MFSFTLAHVQRVYSRLLFGDQHKLTLAHLRCFARVDNTIHILSKYPAPSNVPRQKTQKPGPNQTWPTPHPLAELRSSWCLSPTVVHQLQKAWRAAFLACHEYEQGEIW
jgi:hypothetical protein